MNINTLLNDDGIDATPLADALSQRYLSYALSTIMSRSLPDVRDGLKPVQRRILFAMNELRLNPDQGYKKAARVIGDVIGKFHPHGDSSVYDALVRMAQTFAARYPLVDGQGNFGNIDGDSAAAMRYTEAKLTTVAQALLEDIDKDTVDFEYTYDGEEREPLVLPANFPNLLANGSTGIAVGMATSIPPHNVEELCNGLLHLIKSPNAQIETLMDKIPGPDFATGGVMVEDRAGMLEAYKTGKGSVTVRSKWEKEDLDRGQYQIVVTEIPYHVSKSRLMEKVGELMMNKKLNLISDIQDESAEDVRIVIEPKSRTVDPVVLMETLFKQSEFESKFSINLNVIDAMKTPRVMNLRELLQSFLDHRREVLIRKSEFRLNQIAQRLEILKGYLVVFLNLDRVIQIIREEDQPKPIMIAEFTLTENQAEAILNMRLRSLRKLEEMKIRDEIAELEEEQSGLQALVRNEDLQWQELAEQIRGIKKKFGNSSAYGPRRTIIEKAPESVDLSVESFVEKEPITFVCSEFGWVRAIKGHNVDPDGLKYKEGDRGKFIVPGHTTDQFLILTSDGRFYTILGDKLPSGRGYGEPLNLSLDIDKDADLIAIFPHEKGRKLLLASTNGKGFVVSADTLLAQTKNGRAVVTVKGTDKAVVARYIPENADMVAVTGTSRKMLVFPLSDVSELGKGQGVALQKYKAGRLTDAKAFNAAEGLSWLSGDRTFTLDEFSEWQAGRATQGKSAPRGFPASNLFD